MNHTINIENHFIGKDHPCFIIGEIGSNHNKDNKTVFQLIEACAEAGFDAVKFINISPVNKMYLLARRITLTKTLRVR